jgi:hypothetical protein
MAILPSYFYLSGSPATRFKNPQARGFAGFLLSGEKQKSP